MGSAVTLTIDCGRLGTTSNSAPSPTPSTCSATFPASCLRSIGMPGASSIPSRRGRATGKQSWTWSWPVRGKSRRRSPRSVEQQPEGFFVVRSHDGVIGGFLTLLDLARASTPDIAADPGASAAWEYAQRQAPPRPNEAVTQSRFIVDRDVYQGPSPTLNAMPILTMQRYLATRNLAWDFLTLAEPDHLDEYFAAADLPRAAGADFWVGGRRYGLFAHDFRHVSVDALLELVTERALSQDNTPPPTVEPPVLVLSQPEFDDSVRQALRDQHRPTLLARNPLLRTRLVRDRAGDEEPDAAMLAGLVSEAIETLREHPRDDKRWRAVERTYVRPAGTQERAAEVLGLPFSTFRRHLTQGVERVVAWLWDQEVYGEHH